MYWPRLSMNWVCRASRHCLEKTCYEPIVASNSNGSDLKESIFFAPRASSPDYLRNYPRASQILLDGMRRWYRILVVIDACLGLHAHCVGGPQQAAKSVIGIQIRCRIFQV